jgi:hypothetical protein
MKQPNALIFLGTWATFLGRSLINYIVPRDRQATLEGPYNVAK